MLHEMKRTAKFYRARILGARVEYLSANNKSCSHKIFITLIVSFCGMCEIKRCQF